jgi:hypothetical protein
MKKATILAVINVVIWFIVCLELFYIEPCRVDQPPQRIDVQTLSEPQNGTILA